MALFFLDSSAVVKCYVVETGSGWMQLLADPAVGNEVYIVGVTGPEVASALVRKTPALAPADLAAAIGSFQFDMQQLYQQIELTDSVIARAMDLAQKHRLRGCDAIQLGAATELLAVRLAAGLSIPGLISADARLNAAAQAEGLAVDDPNLHP